MSVPFAGPKIDPEEGHKNKSAFIKKHEANASTYQKFITNTCQRSLQIKRYFRKQIHKE